MMGAISFYGVLGMVPFDFIIGVVVILSVVIILGCSVIMPVDTSEDRFDMVGTDLLFGMMVMVLSSPYSATSVQCR